MKLPHPNFALWCTVLFVSAYFVYTSSVIIDEGEPKELDGPSSLWDCDSDEPPVTGEVIGKATWCFLSEQRRRAVRQATIVLVFAVLAFTMGSAGMMVQCMSKDKRHARHVALEEQV